MKNKLKGFFAAIGFLVVVYVAVVLIVVVASKGKVPDRAILELDLEKPLVEYIPDDPIAQIMLRERMSTRDVVDALERAAGDDRVVGVVARLGNARLGVAQAQEIRNAVMRFREKKKFAVAYAETFGEFTSGGGSYYLATAFDQVYLQPSGDVGLTGMVFESPFVKGTIEKLGMRFRGDHRYEYKNAFNFYTESKYTPAHREANHKVMESWFGQIVGGIAQARKMTPEQVRALVDKGPFFGQEAVDAGLVDKLAYRDEVIDEVKKKAGDKAELIFAHRYLQRAERPHQKGQSIALIYGVGGVQRGKSEYDYSDGSTTMGSETVSAAFRAAVRDKEVKAIIFRVDSPGGSYVASDTIWREVAKAKQAGKPVIVTMGNLAGSGGYFVAMNADKIVAQPGTITASIGVLAGKFITPGFWNKLGVSWDEVHTSQNALIWTGTHDYSPTEWARFQAALDRIYADFTSKVAEGRKLPKDKVLEIAKGRIWTGEDAKALGLVDELGGFPEALKLAKQAAKIPESEDVKLRLFPERKPFLQALLGRGGDSSEKDAQVQAMVQVLEKIQPVMRQLRAVGLVGEREVLEMPAVPQP